jgi:hypothetical protein
MEENEFRSIYQQINTRRCPFEKALNARRCDCTQAKRFLLASRDGVGCKSASCQANCGELLMLLREKSKFVLGLTRVDGPLPHNKEIKVQMGGLLGLQCLLEPALKAEKPLDDVNAVVSAAQERFGSFEQLPFDQIIASVLSFEGRKKR